MVLGRVEYFEQRSRRVTAPVRADLVDLVQQNHRVHRLRVPQGTDDPTGHRSDVGSAVAADLGFVVDSTERNPDELTAKGPGDRLTD